MARLIIAPIDSRESHPSASQIAIERLLLDEGILIERADDATEAVRRFASEEHDLLILTHDDLAQEPRSLAQALSALRSRAAHEGRRFVPVLMLSSAPEHAAITEARSLGVDDVLPMGGAPQAAMAAARVRAYLALSGRGGPGRSPGLSGPYRPGSSPPAPALSLSQRGAVLGSGSPGSPFRHELTQRLVHDLRNPLAGLTSNLAYVDDRLGTAADPEVLEALADCRAAVGRLRRAATMLVDLGQLEEGSLQPRLVSLGVVPMVQDLFAQRRHEATLRDLKLLADIPPGLTASFDPDLVQRLLHALLDHALRYTPAGSTVMLFCSLREGDRLTLRMSADGEWLPQAERIYGPGGPGGPGGQKGPPPASSVVEVGLGLHYAHLVALAHGGTLEVLDEPPGPPRKTTVVVRL